MNIDLETQFLSAEQCRKRANEEDALAKAAKRDNDYGYAQYHETRASEYREKARLKEITKKAFPHE